MGLIFLSPEGARAEEVAGRGFLIGFEGLPSTPGGATRDDEGAVRGLGLKIFFLGGRDPSSTANRFFLSDTDEGFEPEGDVGFFEDEGFTPPSSAEPCAAPRGDGSCCEELEAREALLIVSTEEERCLGLGFSRAPPSS